MYKITLKEEDFISVKFKASAERPEDVASVVHDILVLFGPENPKLVVEITKAPVNEDNREPQTMKGQDHNITPEREVQDANP